MIGQPDPTKAQATSRGGGPPDGSTTGTWACVKVAFDVTMASLLLLAAAPLVALAAIAVRLTSQGPAFYSQVRLGRGGRPFRIYKLRTMFVDAERDGRARWCRPDDPRVTPLGRFLRASHLDELPQLWNILRGDMSLVGPRPERPEIACQLERVFPEYHRRLEVRPGVTGLAQVNLPPDTDLEAVRRKLTYDLYYLENHNLLMDVRLILSTATSLLGVPFATTVRLLRLPGADSVEALVPVAVEFDGVSEIQPA